MAIRTNRFQFISIYCLFILFIISACKKEKAAKEDIEELISPTTGTRTEFTLDSIFLYARQVYLWKEALPNYTEFSPRTKYANYSAEFNAFTAELYELSQLKRNPLTNLPYEYTGAAGRAKYSYIELGKSSGRVASTVIISPDNPVNATATFTIDGTNIGYVSLSSFPRLSKAKSYLDEAFNQLAKINTKKIIVDLRSNGGGYVETAEYVANLIAPSSLNGKVAYIEQFNDLMRQGKATILRHQPYLDENNKPVIYKGRNATMADVDYTEAGNTYNFSKKGNLENIEQVYFIVTGNTASASELLISCLKPYLQIKLAGTKTYGKPVGFFGVTIDKYNVYLSGFLIKNAAGYSDYFDGMDVDIPVVSNGINEPGNPNDVYISQVLSYIQTGNVNAKVSLMKESSNAISSNLPKENIDVKPTMIEHRMKLN